MLEELLLLTLEAEGPNVMLFNKTAVSASVYTFQFKISMEMNWQRHPFCLATSCHWLQTNKMSCLHFTTAHCFAKTLEGYELLWLHLYPPSYRLVDLVWFNRMHNKCMNASTCVDQTSMPIWYVLDYLWCTHWTSVSELLSVDHKAKSHNLQIYVQFAFHCLLFLEQYCIQIVYSLCVYFFLWPLCSLCCTCLNIIYFCLEYCSILPEAEDEVLFCAMGIHPSTSGFIWIWHVWSFIFICLKLAFPSLPPGSVPLNS